jgi:hypothetical protein
MLLQCTACVCSGNHGDEIGNCEEFRQLNSQIHTPLKPDPEIPSEPVNIYK